MIVEPVEEGGFLIVEESAVSFVENNCWQVCAIDFGIICPVSETGQCTTKTNRRNWNE